MSNDRKRMRIVSALLQLLESKSLEDITVSDIAQAAEITRPTFYKYFNNKIEVLMYLIRAYHQEAVDKSESFSEYRINWGQLLFDKHNKNPKVADRIFQSEIYGIYQNKIYQYVFTLIKENCPDIEITEATNVAARIWSAGAVAALRSWLSGLPNITAREFCEYYTLGMPDVVRQAFLRNDSKIITPQVYEDDIRKTISE